MILKTMLVCLGLFTSFMMLGAWCACMLSSRISQAEESRQQKKQSASNN